MQVFSVAANGTPGGIPVVGILVMVGLLALFVWDSLRLPAGVWFRWLMPVGFVPLMAGVFIENYWVIGLGAVIMGIGLALGKGQRQKDEAGWF
jgi:cytochrome c biogenesis protein ResB